MTSSSDVVKCTVHNGVLWMHLHEKRLKIHSLVVNKSQLLTDMLSSAADPTVSSDFTLAARKEWLLAWTSLWPLPKSACCCSGNKSRSYQKSLRKRLRDVDIADLLNSLLVCFCYRNTDASCLLTA
jgi:hypothetical protein